MPFYKRLPDVPDILLCSDGYAINVNTGWVYKNVLKKTGYCEISVNGKCYLIHRLIARAFCDGFAPNKEVNHIDGNKLNNAASNLEWVDHNENLRHAYLKGLRENDVSNKVVIATDMVTGEKTVYTSIYQAAKLLKISKGNICLCCRGKRPYANGFYWEYAKGVMDYE